MVRRKKAVGKTLIIIIIVMVAIVISAIVVANATNVVLDGLLQFFGPNCSTLNKVSDLTEKSCELTSASYETNILIPKHGVDTGWWLLTVQLSAFLR